MCRSANGLYFQVCSFFFPPPTNSRVLLLSECECSVSRGLCVYVPSSSLSLMSPLGHMTTICHQLHDLRFGCTISLWFKHHTFLFLKIFLNYYFHPPAIFLFPLIEWADAGGDLLLCMRVDRRLDRPIRRLHLTFSLPASFLWCNKAAQKNKSIPSVSAHHIPLDMTDCVLLFKFVCIFWVCVLVLIYMEQSN